MPKVKAKAKAAAAKSVAIKAVAETEKKEKAVLSTWKLQTNRLGRIEKIMKDNLKEWKWAEDDLVKYRDMEADLTKYIAEKGLTDFVGDFTAAIFAPQDMKLFRNQRKDSLLDSLTLLIEGAVPAVKSMEIPRGRFPLIDCTHVPCRQRREREC